MKRTLTIISIAMLLLISCQSVAETTEEAAESAVNKNAAEITEKAVDEAADWLSNLIFN